MSDQRRTDSIRSKFDLPLPNRSGTPPAIDTALDDHHDEWIDMAEEARKLIGSRVAGGHPTVDDIKKTLQPLVELHPQLLEHLANRKWTQKYWIGDARLWQPWLRINRILRVMLPTDSARSIFRRATNSQ